MVRASQTLAMVAVVAPGVSGLAPCKKGCNSFVASKQDRAKLKKNRQKKTKKKTPDHQGGSL